MPFVDPASRVDIVANRGATKWSKRELAVRALWETVGCFLFTLMPRPMWGWRRLLLRCFGASVGRHVHIFPSAKIAIPWNLSIDHNSSIGDGAIIYNLGAIVIGAGATVSQYAHLCAGTHDFRRADMLLLKSPITIGSGAWICADAFVGPGVTIGAMAVVGARAVVAKNVAANEIVVGNPARVVGKRVLNKSL
jgi:putative colanic acid biosynthesis acetyltransferase WcaF